MSYGFSFGMRSVLGDIVHCGGYISFKGEENDTQRS